MEEMSTFSTSRHWHSSSSEPGSTANATDDSRSTSGVLPNSALHLSVASRPQVNAKRSASACLFVGLNRAKREREESERSQTSIDVNRYGGAFGY
jgi:hypothetical protein